MTTSPTVTPTVALVAAAMRHPDDVLLNAHISGSTDRLAAAVEVAAGLVDEALHRPGHAEWFASATSLDARKRAMALVRRAAGGDWLVDEFLAGDLADVPETLRALLDMGYALDAGQIAGVAA